MVASPSEASVERYLTRRVREAGGMSVKLVPGDKGLPDRMVLHEGRIFLIELKRATGGRVSPAQRAWHHRAEQAGVAVHVLAGRAAVDTFLTEHGIDGEEQ